ncbi:hypothetical protein CDD83_5131 [Cordyceps sp. RAO-2017]|nr:hypothetical protein CDD83_5131 [Cordyceps sp. RAO-2017]
MLRPSLDGKGRKMVDMSPSASDFPRLSPARKTLPANLKEASPPKTNPWRRVKAQRDEPPTPSDRDATFAARDFPAVSESHSPFPSPSARDDGHRDDAVCATHKARQRFSTLSPSSTWQIFQAAAPRAGESLWNLPFGADIWLYAEDTVFQLHRSVVAPKLGWLRDKLLPPNSNGAPVGVFFPGPLKIIGHSLKFMYTGRLEPCEPNQKHPRDVAHVICCVLFYLAAADLRAHTIASHVLDTLARTSDDWRGYVDDHFSKHAIDRQEGMAFTLYLKDALEAAYAYPHHDVVHPLRLALVGFLDSALPLIVQHGTVIPLLSTSAWRRHSSAIAADLAEHRRNMSSAQGSQGGVSCDEEALEALFDSMSTKGCGSVTWESSGSATDASTTPS